jgi:hypothetical protein
MVFLPKPEMVRRKLTAAPAVPGNETDFQNSPRIFSRFQGTLTAIFVVVRPSQPARAVHADEAQKPIQYGGTP